MVGERKWERSRGRKGGKIFWKFRGKKKGLRIAKDSWDQPALGLDEKASFKGCNDGLFPEALGNRFVNERDENFVSILFFLLLLSSAGAVYLSSLTRPSDRVARDPGAWGQTVRRTV